MNPNTPSQVSDKRFAIPHDPYQALYLHIPFCVSRCRYCDFTTRAIDSSDPAIDRYIENLSLDIRRAAKLGELGALQTVYIGGGTPSHVGISRLSMLLYTLSLSMHLTDDVECSMEANPESLNDHMVRDIWALGVNRLSLGVQSFDDDVLRLLGRAHNADAARRAISQAQSRFDNISIDLIAGIPNTALQAFVNSVEETISQGIPHVSIYPLTIEDSTPFALMLKQGQISEIDEDEQADAMLEAESLLTHAGYNRYEVASYAKPGFECRHNKAYWTAVPYLGLGEGATTMLQNENGRMRITNREIDEELSDLERQIEDLMLGMRMTQGVSDEMLREIKVRLPRAENVFKELMSYGLVEHHNGRWTPTQRGWICGNELYGRILSLGD